MYQFYYADKEKNWNRRTCNENIRNRFRITVNDNGTLSTTPVT